MSKIGVEMKDFQAQAAEREPPVPEGVEARALYGEPAQPDRSALATLATIVVVCLAAAAAGYVAIVSLSGSG